MNSTEKESKNILDEALKDVIQEILITDEDGKAHLVYVHRIFWDNGLKVEFSTPDDNKEALIPLVHDAIFAQISDIPKPEITLWDKVKEKAYNFFQMFSNIS